MRDAKRALSMQKKLRYRQQASTMRDAKRALSMQKSCATDNKHRQCEMQKSLKCEGILGAFIHHLTFPGFLLTKSAHEEYLFSLTGLPCCRK